MEDDRRPSTTSKTLSSTGTKNGSEVAKKKNLFDDNDLKKKTRGVSTRSETATIDEDHAPFARLTNRQRKRSGRKEMKEMKVGNL